MRTHFIYKITPTVPFRTLKILDHSSKNTVQKEKCRSDLVKVKQIFRGASNEPYPKGKT